MKTIVVKIWPVFCIVLLWLAFVFPYMWKGTVPFPSAFQVSFFPPWNASYGMAVKNNAMPDIITQIYPWKKLTIDTWRSGQIPLWNPYSFSGTAHAGNYQTAVFSPFNLLFLVMSQVDAWTVIVLLQPLLAGLLMYLCLRGFDRGREAAILGSIAFMFSGFIVVWMAYGTLGYAALFLPLIFWGIHKKHGLAISLGIALSLVSGHFQVSIYVIGAATAYILWTKQWRTLLYVAAGVLIAMPQLLLTLHTYENSMRSTSFVKGEVIPWSYIVTFIAPDFYGNPVTRNDWFGHYAEWAGFIGVLPLMLAFYVVLSKKNTQKLFFVLLTVVSLLFALPTPLNDFLYWAKIPVLSTSAASRIIILTSFSLSLLAAFGFDGLADDWKKKNWVKIAGFLAGSMVVLGIIWLTLVIGHDLPIDKAVIARRNFLMPSLFVAAGAGLFLFGLCKNKIVRVLVIAGMLVLTSFDLLRFTVKWMPSDAKSLVFPTTSAIEFLTKTVGNNRVFGNFGNELSTYFHIPSLEGYDAVYQARYGEFISTASDGTLGALNRSVVLLDKNGLYTEDILRLLGARYILYRKSDARNIWTYPFWKYPSYRMVYSDSAYEVWENPDALERVFLASSYTVAGNDKDIIGTLFANNFDRRNSLVLEEKPSIEPKSGSGSAEIASYTPDKVTIKTSASSPKLLFLSDVYDTGWYAFVDGKATPMYRADYDFRAVGVPAGTHTVQFIYQPKELLLGALMSVMGVGILIWSSRRKHI